MTAVAVTAVAVTLPPALMLPVMPTPPITCSAPVAVLVLAVPDVIAKSVGVAEVGAALAMAAPVTSIQYVLVPSLMY